MFEKWIDVKKVQGVAEVSGWLRTHEEVAVITFQKTSGGKRRAVIKTAHHKQVVDADIAEIQAGVTVDWSKP